MTPITQEQVRRLAKKLHEWQWEACREELPRKHGPTPAWKTLDGTQIRILMRLAEKILEALPDEGLQASEEK